MGTAEAPPGRGIPPAIWDGQRPMDSQPLWFGPVSSQVGWKTYTWRAGLRPPPGDTRLALTLVFRQSLGGFARVIWQEPGKSITLCGNLYEQAADLHQRTLLLDRGTLSQPGQLLVESTGAEPVLERAEFNWVEPLVLAAGWNSATSYYLSPSGKIFPADELQDGGRRAPADEEKGMVTDAVLDAGPVKIDSLHPVRFLAPIAEQPSFGRFQAEVAGLLPGDEPWVWVNGRTLAGVAVESPGLDDPGYRAEAEAQEIRYGGWRKVWAFVPGGLLKNGENQIDIQLASGLPGCTFRDLRLQVAFGENRASRNLSSIAVVGPTPVAKGFWAKTPGMPGFRTGLSSGASVVGLRQE